MPVPLALAVAGACALLAALLTPWLRRELGGDSASPRSRLVQLRTHAVLAGLLGLGAARLGDGWVEIATFALTGVLCAALVVVDLVCLRLPDRMVAAAAGALFVGLVAVAALDGDWQRLGRAALAALVLVVGYFVLAFANPAGLGLGDVKFAAVVGGFLGWFGWAHVGSGTLAAFVLNAVVALVVLVTRRGGKDTGIPFGPWMVAGAVVAVALLPTQ